MAASPQKIASTITPASQIATFNSQTNLFHVIGGQEAYGLSNAIELKNNDYLVEVVVKTSLSLTFAASTAATQVTIADPDFPYTAVGPLTFTPATGDRLAYADGRFWELFMEYSRPTYWDRRTKVALPVTSTTEATTGTLTVYSVIPVTVSRSNLYGLYLLQAQGNTAKIKQDWQSVAAIAAALNIPAGSSLTGVTGTYQIAEILYSVPAVNPPTAGIPMEYLATDHRIINETDIPLVGLTKATKSFLQTGTILRVGLLFTTAAGFRDVGNSLGLTTIQLQIGNTQFPINIEEDYEDVMDQQSGRYNPDPLFRGEDAALAAPARHSTSGDGIYWLDRTQNAPADWINTELFNNNTIALNLAFSTACPAGTYCRMLVESMLGPGAAK